MFARIALPLLLLPSILFAKPTAPTAITEAQFLKELAAAMERVDEFRVIREKARALGVDVYLFGGTAAAFAHYVRQYLEWKAGDKRYTAARFDFRYASIFHSLQDIDLVLDGPESAAAELEREVRQRFDYFQGNRSSWEVRLLRQQRGAKEPLLDNPDFANQNTDTGSIALMLVSDPNGSRMVRDLLAWNSPKSRFLTDVLAKRIRFLRSATHNETARARQGLNPEIFSVVRCLTKRYQFGLDVPAEDDAEMRKVVAEFRAAQLSTPYAKEWIQKYGKKMFAMAMSVEDAWNNAEELGLRKRLQELPPPPTIREEDSLPIWMDKEPLRTRRFRKPRAGELTAGAMGITRVAHGTSSYRTYESITRSPFRLPNVFRSRNGKKFESAGFAEGLYSLEGDLGGKNIEYSIRFDVDPRAILGVDFFVSHRDRRQGPRVVVVDNAAMLRVVPESLDLSPVDALALIDSDEIGIGDRGIRDRLFRDTRSRLAADPDGYEALYRAVHERLAKRTLTANAAILWLSLPGAASYRKSFADFSSFLQKADWSDGKLGLPAIALAMVRLCRAQPEFGTRTAREELFFFLSGRKELRASDTGQELRQMFVTLGTLLTQQGAEPLRKLYVATMREAQLNPTVVAMWMGSKAYEWEPESLDLWRKRYLRLAQGSKPEMRSRAYGESRLILEAMVATPEWFMTDAALDVMFAIMDNTQPDYRGVADVAIDRAIDVMVAMRSRSGRQPARSFVDAVQRRFDRAVKSDDSSMVTLSFAMRVLPESRRPALLKALVAKLKKDAKKRPTPDSFFEIAKTLLALFASDASWASNALAWDVLAVVASTKNHYHEHFSNRDVRMRKMSRQDPVGKAAANLLLNPAWMAQKPYVAFLTRLLEAPDYDQAIDRRSFSPAIFHRSEILAMPESSRWLRLAFRRTHPENLPIFATSILTNPVWADSAEAFELLAELLMEAADYHHDGYRNNVANAFRDQVLPTPAWQKSPALRRRMPKGAITIERLLREPELAILPDIEVAAIARRNDKRVPNDCAKRLVAAGRKP